MKTVLKLGVVTVLAMSLFGCSPSPKQEFLKGHQELLEAKTLGMVSFMNIEMTSNTRNPAMDRFFYQVNEAHLRMDLQIDRENQKTEGLIDYHGPFGTEMIDKKIPYLIDKTDNKLFLKAWNLENLIYLRDSLTYDQVDIFLPEDVKDDSVVIDLPEPKELTKEEKEVQAKVNEELNEKLLDLLKELPDENFKKEKNVVTLTIESEQLYDMVFEVLENNREDLDMPITKEELKTTLKSFKEKFPSEEIVVKSTIKEGKIIKDEITFPVTAEIDNVSVTSTFHMNNEYFDINKPIEFTFNKGEVITLDEFYEIYEQLFYEQIIEPYE